MTETPPVAPTGGDSVTEAQLTQIMEEYLQRLEQGETPDRQEYFARFPDLAATLEVAFNGLDFLHQGATGILPPGASDFGPAAMRESVLGDFRIVRELGRGGMGIVYEAEQISLGRRVAVKVLPFASLLDERNLERFKNEARAAAMLKHPNIVSVYSVGCQRGVHYYAMQYIDGRPLSAVIDDLRHRRSRLDSDAHTASEVLGRHAAETEPIAHFSTADPRNMSKFHCDVARFGAEIAAALQYAHEQGVIHRDIKPSNILLDNQGRAWIADFGLAHVDAEKSLTITGDLLGTLRYMSPEQTSGRAAVLDARTDIYSLGISLYELLTLQPAFAQTERHTLLRQIEESDPPPVRRLNPALGKDLETIIIKATAKRPEQRYQSAREMSEDLQRFVQQLPVRARRSNPCERLGRWTRRNPLLALTSFLAVGLLLFLGIAGPIVALRQRALLQDMLVQNFVLSLAGAWNAWDEGNLEQAVELLAPYEESGHRLDTGQFAYQHLLNRIRLSRTSDLAHPTEIRQVEFFEDGRKLATRDVKGVIRIWDLATRSLEKTLNASAGHEENDVDTYKPFSFSGDAKHLATADGSTIDLWNVEGLSKVTSLQGHTSTVRVLQYVRPVPGLDKVPKQNSAASRDSGNAVTGVAAHSAVPDALSENIASAEEHRLVSGDRGGAVILWDPHGDGFKTLVPPTEGVRGEITGLASSPDGNLLVVAKSDGAVLVYRLSDGSLIESLRTLQSSNYPTVVAFSPDGSLMAAGGNELKLWTTVDWKLAGRIDVNRQQINALSFSPDGQVIGVATSKQVTLFELETRHKTTAFTWPESKVRDLDFSPDGSILVGVGTGGFVRLWQNQAWSLAQETDYGNWGVRVRFTDRLPSLSLVVGHGGLFASEQRGGITIVDLKTGQQETFRPGGPTWSVLSRCPDQPELFAFGDQENGIEVWNLRTRQRLRQLDFNHRQVWGLALAPGGQRLAASSFDSSSWQDPTIKVWDGESDTPKTFAEFAALCLEFSPDGQLLIAAGGTWRQGRVAFFDVTSGTRKHDDLLLPSFAYGTVLDPEGRVLAIAHADSNVILWDLTQQKTLYKIRLAMPVVTLAFSPDAQTIAIGGWDNTVTLWHRTTGQQLGVLKTSGVIMSLEFSDDGDILAAGSGDRTVTLWYRDGHKQVHRIQ